MLRRHARSVPALFFVLASLLYGCGSEDITAPETNPVPPLVSGDVDGGGGELVHENVTLTVPGGALDEAVALAVYAEGGDHPFGEDAAPVYRISGLPQGLNAPVTLRFRHGIVVPEGGALTCFLGEERQAYSGGSGLSWFSVAGRDSAGWAIVELERGALDLGDKAEGDVQATATSRWEWMISDADHFEVGYDPTVVSDAQASKVLSEFDRMYNTYEQWGFEFGDNDTIWPLKVNIRTPIKSWACYVTAPHGAGHFDIDPIYLTGDLETLPVVAHELLHCVQTFYDPRPPEDWGVLNQERMWLDEATAAYLEAISSESSEAYPEGMDDDNYDALLAGIAGHPDLENDVYGYGMVQFIAYLVEIANPTNGEALVLELFQHFKIHGDVTDAIDAVVTPPVASWCVDMQRKWALNDLYPGYPTHWFWHQWPAEASLEAATGSSSSATLTVADLGAGLAKFNLVGSDPDPMTGLMIETRPDDPQLPPEALPITLYGRALDSGLTQLATGTGEVLVPDWPAIFAAYEDVFVMVSRPYSTAAGHTGTRDIRVTATVMPDLSGIDVTSFNRAVIEVKTDIQYYNVSSVLYNYTVSIQAEVSWNGTALQCAAPGDTFSIVVNPTTFALGSWYGADHFDSIGGTWIVRRLAGTAGVPLDDWSETGLIYRMRGLEVCDHLTHMFESKASDDETPPYLYVTGYSCRSGDTAWDQSVIYIHLFRSGGKSTLAK